MQNAKLFHVLGRHHHHPTAQEKSQHLPTLFNSKTPAGTILLSLETSAGTILLSLLLLARPSSPQLVPPRDPQDWGSPPAAVLRPPLPHRPQPLRTLAALAKRKIPHGKEW